MVKQLRSLGLKLLFDVRCTISRKDSELISTPNFVIVFSLQNLSEKMDILDVLYICNRSIYALEKLVTASLTFPLTPGAENRRPISERVYRVL